MMMQQPEMMELARIWRHYLANGRSSLEKSGDIKQIMLVSSSTYHGTVVQPPISLKATPFNIQVKDSTFFATSALACLSLPALLGETAQVKTICPANGSEILITVTQEGITNSHPEDCVLSVVVPDPSLGDIYDSADRFMGSINHLMRYFSSAAAASTWLVAYPGVTVLAMDDAWQFARALFFREEVGAGDE